MRATVARLLILVVAVCLSACEGQAEVTSCARPVGWERLDGDTVRLALSAGEDNQDVGAFVFKFEGDKVVSHLETASSRYKVEMEEVTYDMPADGIKAEIHVVLNDADIGSFWFVRCGGVVYYTLMAPAPEPSSKVG